MWEERVVADFRKELTKEARSSDQKSGLSNNASILYSEYAQSELLSGDNKCPKIFHGFTHSVLTNARDSILHHITNLMFF